MEPERAPCWPDEPFESVAIGMRANGDALVTTMLRRGTDRIPTGALPVGNLRRTVVAAVQNAHRRHGDGARR